VPFVRRPPPTEPEDAARLARELLKLDPWAYWTVELEPDAGVLYAVLGTTGAFVVAACPLEGYLVAEGRKLTVDGRPVEGFREVKRAAKVLSGKLISISAGTNEVVPLLVLTRAAAGGPRERDGVPVLRPEDVVPTITARSRVLEPSTAEILANRIGRVLRGPAHRVDDEE
jgi:hypothetical protein